MPEIQESVVVPKEEELPLEEDTKLVVDLENLLDDDEEEPVRTIFSIDDYKEQGYDDPDKGYLAARKVVSNESLEDDDEIWEDLFETFRADSTIRKHLSTLNSLTKVEVTQDKLKDMSKSYGAAWLRRGCWHTDMDDTDSKSLWNDICKNGIAD
ncbi:hypothetical protein [Candidatus Mycoplasma haematohominis]|uniref:Uncharacterized protein n=1 Tax=Candidatus Mycoplasma haematohominis TaxID=1494318 RepID=A0A478FQZ9_9MOLU|nr:hypothetical protein [Candidatus Mycoplasma haemohominis]GCE63913.1 hypothetical protein MHSWG343_09200 [Candidatus Mycoplasma haemohominis]